MLHDLTEVYKYLNDNLELLRQSEELAQTILFALRDEKLFLNVDGQEDPLNWVQGSALAFDCQDREGSMQDVRQFLRPFEKILVAAEAIRVRHPSHKPAHDPQQSESLKLQKIWSSFDQLRKMKVLTDVEFVAQPQATNVLSPEPLFAHRVVLAASSEYFKDYFTGDFQESRDASPGAPLTIEVQYSWQCIRSFLGKYRRFLFHHPVLIVTSRLHLHGE